MRGTRSKYKELKEGDTLDGAVITRVAYKSGVFVEFQCQCGTLQQHNVGNFLRKSLKLCTPCSIAYVAKLKEKYIYKDRDMYRIWKSMNWRCDSVKGHPAYIKKGIAVCPEWSESNPEGFNNFLRDMYPRPSKMTVERIDNSKGYSKENCKWADMKEQQNNRENNHVVEYDGKSWTIQQLSEHIGMKSNTLLCRIRRGWTVEEAVSGSRDIIYKRPYIGVLSDDQFFSMLYELIEEGKDQMSVGIKYSVSPSNISRIIRKPKVIEWYNKRNIDNESLG